MIKQRKHSKVFDMVEDELRAINKIKDASKRLRKLHKIRHPKGK